MWYEVHIVCSNCPASATVHFQTSLYGSSLFLSLSLLLLLFKIIIFIISFLFPTIFIAFILIDIIIIDVIIISAVNVHMVFTIDVALFFALFKNWSTCFDCCFSVSANTLSAFMSSAMFGKTN